MKLNLDSDFGSPLITLDKTEHFGLPTVRIDSTTGSSCDTICVREQTMNWFLYSSAHSNSSEDSLIHYLSAGLAH